MYLLYYEAEWSNSTGAWMVSYKEIHQSIKCEERWSFLSCLLCFSLRGMMGEQRKGHVSVFISIPALEAHSSPPTQLPSGVKQQTHTYLWLRKESVCVCFWPGVGEAPQFRSRLSGWQTAHCGIWRDSSLAAQTCTPGLTRYTGPTLAFTESHIWAF